MLDYQLSYKLKFLRYDLKMYIRLTYKMKTLEFGIMLLIKGIFILFWGIKIHMAVKRSGL